MNEIERCPIDCDLLRSFIAIARCGNLTVAAGHLGRTQSAISVQLRRLEDGLGATLFERTAKGMTLTPAGQTLLPRARAVLASLRETSALFARPLSGTIRIGLPDDYDAAVLEHALAGFAAAHPGVNVVATSGCTSGFSAAIRDGALDIAVCSGADNREGETLGLEPTVWAARAGLRIGPERPVPLAILDRACWWRDLPVRALDGIGRDYMIAFRSGSFASLQAAIRSGFAIGVVPGASLDDRTVALTAAEGFPDLPASRRSIVIAKTAPPELAASMAEAIRNARYEMHAAR